MLLLNGHIEETILTYILKHGPTRTTALFSEIQAQHPCTRQGFYRALRKLRSDERIAVYRSVVSINELWLRRLRAFVVQGDNDTSAIGDIRKLGAGESLTLTLKGLSNMDRLWSHLFSLVEQTIDVQHPLFLYNPHNWSALLRPETDRIHEQVLRERERPAYLLVGSSSGLDKAAYQSVRFEHLEVSHNSKVQHEHYIAVIADFIFELRFTPRTRKAIHGLFQTAENVQKGRALLAKMDQTTMCKITIERNSTKAREWRKRIAQDFYIPKKYRQP
jgi:hypothetical protein